MALLHLMLFPSSAFPRGQGVHRPKDVCLSTDLAPPSRSCVFLGLQNSLPQWPAVFWRFPLLLPQIHLPEVGAPQVWGVTKWYFLWAVYEAFYGERREQVRVWVILLTLSILVHNSEKFKNSEFNLGSSSRFFVELERLNALAMGTMGILWAEVG